MAADLEDAPGELFAFQGDLCKEEDVVSAFAWIKDNLGGVDVLINNAGVLIQNNLHNGPSEEWKRMIDVNVLGLCMCTREAVTSMRERGIDDGYIINISSIAGHVSPGPTGFSMYSASKHAVRVLGEGIRMELVAMGSRIRVSNISPGVVITELFDGLGDEIKDMLTKGPHMFPEDISDAVIYLLNTPERVQVQDIIIKPTGTPY